MVMVNVPAAPLEGSIESQPALLVPLAVMDQASPVVMVMVSLLPADEVRVMSLSETSSLRPAWVTFIVLVTSWQTTVTVAIRSCT